MSEITSRMAEAMQKRRRQLISMPLERIWEDLAVAALESIRKPTDEMVAATAHCGSVIEAWQVMIDEALK